jgi:hypothetical protein
MMMNRKGSGRGVIEILPQPDEKHGDPQSGLPLSLPRTNRVPLEYNAGALRVDQPVRRYVL